MADEDKDSKTEEPTEKKLSSARDEGNVASSQEIKSLATLSAALILVTVFVPWISGAVTDIARTFLERPHTFAITPESVTPFLATLSLEMLLLLAIPFAMFVMISVMANILQFGWLWTFAKMKPDINKISPISGIKKMFSLRQLLEGAKAILKLVIIAPVAGLILIPYLSEPERLMSQPIGVTIQELREILILLLIIVVMIMTVISVADFSFQKWKFKDDMKMSKQEVKEEHKNAEGDPQVKARIRKLRMKRAMERMMAQVPDASVVITNPTHYAVALKYDMDSMSAPLLVAKGQDAVALRIRDTAEAN
ncbi:MAG: EscU/YscU/HrcU family type III secretion system export apparatus switch protein, partial [Rhodospirillaceae bacterium]